MPPKKTNYGRPAAPSDWRPEVIDLTSPTPSPVLRAVRPNLPSPLAPAAGSPARSAPAGSPVSPTATRPKPVSPTLARVAASTPNRPPSSPSSDSSEAPLNARVRALSGRVPRPTHIPDSNPSASPASPGYSDDQPRSPSVASVAPPTDNFILIRIEGQERYLSLEGLENRRRTQMASRVVSIVSESFQHQQFGSASPSPEVSDISLIVLSWKRGNRADTN